MIALSLGVLTGFLSFSRDFSSFYTGQISHQHCKGQDLLLESVYAAREVLGHLSGLDGVHARLLQLQTEVHEVLVAVQLASVLQTARPRVNTRYRVGARGVTLSRYEIKPIRKIVTTTGLVLVGLPYLYIE